MLFNVKKCWRNPQEKYYGVTTKANVRIIEFDAAIK